ncbi:MAG: GNAT family N-acetyltransferase [Aestuariibacter sp.]|nr:GNAT family N-acetyltransferase [Aestuariibacter sp.]
MSQHTEYIIEPYTHDHDPSLAAMWNESDDQWPGSFTDGVPYTAKRIADWMDKEVALMRLIVRTQTGKVVGYGSLCDAPNQPGRSCYVDLLNIHSDHQGRSLCRRMLTKMVEYATEHGYARITLGTWPANLKAVPLYKKVGFYWKPNSNVYMENYIPMLRRLPSLRNFFARINWYAHQSRELQQVEDEQRHAKTGDTEVYICRWTRSDDSWIEAIIDRKAQTVTGLETTEFAVHACVDESKPALGISYPVTWEITNKRNTPLPVHLAASGDTYVQIAHDQDFILAAGETRIITADYRCMVNAPRLTIDEEDPKPTPQINTMLRLDGEELNLGSGLHYEPAADISLYPSPVTITPELAQTVWVQVKNQLDRPMRGELQIVTTDGLTTDWQRRAFAADAQGYAGIPLQLSCRQEGTPQLELMATFQDRDQQIRTAPQPLPVLVRNVGDLAAIVHHPDPTKTAIYAENDFFYFGAEQREGRMRVRNKAGQDYQISLSETLGPPYEPDEFEERDYEVSLRQEVGRIHVTYTIASNNFPGLILGREVTIVSSPLVQVRNWLKNDGEVTLGGKIRTTVQLANNSDTNAQVTLPRRERLLIAMSNTLPEVEGDFPRKPAEVAEQWGAYSTHGQVHGVVWNKDITEHEWRLWYLDLFSAEWNIPAKSRVELSPIFLYCGPGDWRDVRRFWQQRNGQTKPTHLDNRSMPAPSGPQQVTLTPNPALTQSDEVTVKLHADNLRQQAINGRILFTPPAGWSADETEFALEEIKVDKSFEATIRLTSSHLSSANPPIGPATGEVTLQTNSFDSAQPFTILRLGDKRRQVQVSQEKVQDNDLWYIDNGRMKWTIAPNYHAGIVAWRERGSEINHLYSAFPYDGEFDFIKPWFGGLHPILNGNRSGWPGKFHQEHFVATETEMMTNEGLRWHGVRLATTIQAQKAIQGIRAEIDYLTLPNSNLIKARFCVTNNAPIYRSIWNPLSDFMIYCQVDGSYENSVLYGEHPHAGPCDDTVQRKRTAYSQWLRVGNWAAIVNTDTKRALTVVAPNAPENIVLMDSGALGGHLMVNQTKPLPPNGTHELVVYIALVDSLVEAQQHACLG